MMEEKKVIDLSSKIITMASNSGLSPIEKQRSISRALDGCIAAVGVMYKVEIKDGDELKGSIRDLLDGLLGNDRGKGAW